MGRLISVVGNSGVGKTTFVRNLSLGTKYYLGLEQHEERPFQELFMQDKNKYALANQIDYMIFRAQQELTIRDGEQPGIQDGGLDQDFFVFTKLFFHNGYLSEKEFGICEQAYKIIRMKLPPPDLIIWMKAPLDLIADQHNIRNRRLDITRVEDMEIIEALLDKWLFDSPADNVLVIDYEEKDPDYASILPKVRELINSLG